MRRRWPKDKLDRILQLLRDTDLPMPVIAVRMGIGSGTVASINRRHKIRSYGGRHESWEVRQTEEVHHGDTA